MESFVGRRCFNDRGLRCTKQPPLTAFARWLVQGSPMVIEVVDTQENVNRLIPVLDEMAPGRLVTMEKVQVSKDATGPRIRRPHGGAAGRGLSTV